MNEGIGVMMASLGDTLRYAIDTAADPGPVAGVCLTRGVANRLTPRACFA